MFLRRLICFKEKYLNNYMVLLGTPTTTPHSVVREVKCVFPGLMFSFFWSIHRRFWNPRRCSSLFPTFKFFFPWNTSCFLLSLLHLYKLRQLWPRISHIKMIWNYSSQRITKKLLFDNALMMWLFKQDAVNLLRVTNFLWHVECCYCHSLDWLKT